jgi:hypothetical protein
MRQLCNKNVLMLERLTEFMFLDLMNIRLLQVALDEKVSLSEQTAQRKTQAQSANARINAKVRMKMNASIPYAAIAIAPISILSFAHSNASFSFCLPAPSSLPSPPSTLFLTLPEPLTGILFARFTSQRSLPRFTSPLRFPQPTHARRQSIPPSSHTIHKDL